MANPFLDAEAVKALSCDPVRLSLTDSAQRRYDLPTRDLACVTTRIWKDRPDLKIAFTGSYGQLSDLDAYIIKLCTAIDAASLATAIGT